MEAKNGSVPEIVMEGTLEVDSNLSPTDTQSLPHKPSFKETLLASKESTTPSRSAFLGPEDSLLDDSMQAESEGGDPRFPSITLGKDDLNRLRQPWRSAVIFQPMGKSIGYHFLCSRVDKLLKARGEYEVIDLGYDCFLFKFDQLEDRERVLTEGPWMIADHYLTVRCWSPEFRPSMDTISKIPVWVRLPELPIEYFDEDLLFRLGAFLGKPLKIDTNTALAARGRFARLCVEIGLDKPLVSKVKIGNLWQKMEYEGLHSICFSCGRVGHREEVCPYKGVFQPGADKMETTSAHQPASKSDDTSSKNPENLFGPWLMVSKPARRPSRPKVVSDQAHHQVDSHKGNTGSRFDALSHGPPEETHMVHSQLNLAPSPSSSQIPTGSMPQSQSKGIRLNQGSDKGNHVRARGKSVAASPMPAVSSVLHPSSSSALALIPPPAPTSLHSVNNRTPSFLQSHHTFSSMDEFPALNPSKTTHHHHPSHNRIIPHSSPSHHPPSPPSAVDHGGPAPPATFYPHPQAVDSREPGCLSLCLGRVSKTRSCVGTPECSHCERDCGDGSSVGGSAPVRSIPEEGRSGTICSTGPRSGGGYSSG